MALLPTTPHADADAWRRTVRGYGSRSALCLLCPLHEVRVARPATQLAPVRLPCHQRVRSAGAGRSTSEARVSPVSLSVCESV